MELYDEPGYNEETHRSLVSDKPSVHHYRLKIVLEYGREHETRNPFAVVLVMSLSVIENGSGIALMKCPNQIWIWHNFVDIFQNSRNIRRE